jgi:hypothetical protein
MYKYQYVKCISIWISSVYDLISSSNERAITSHICNTSKNPGVSVRISLTYRHECYS